MELSHEAADGTTAEVLSECAGCCKGLSWHGAPTAVCAAADACQHDVGLQQRQHSVVEFYGFAPCRESVAQCHAQHLCTGFAQERSAHTCLQHLCRAGRRAVNQDRDAQLPQSGWNKNNIRSESQRPDATFPRTGLCQQCAGDARPEGGRI